MVSNHDEQFLVSVNKSMFLQFVSYKSVLLFKIISFLSLFCKATHPTSFTKLVYINLQNHKLHIFL